MTSTDTSSRGRTDGHSPNDPDGDGAAGSPDTTQSPPTETGDTSAGESRAGGPTVSRRGALRGIGTAALASGALGGAASSASAQSSGGDVDSWLSNTSNHDGIVDQTGQSSVTVEVGVEANGGAFGFGPAAIRVSPDTTVTWEWTGNGGSHDVVDTEGDFESDLTDSAGHTFDHAFSEPGTYTYSCTPHETLGMKGAAVVASGSAVEGGNSGGAGSGSEQLAAPFGNPANRNLGGYLLASVFGLALASPGLFGAFLWLTGDDEPEADRQR
ncbi:MAG: halocyanin domain-containing protein [Halobellus sp.]